METALTSFLPGGYFCKGTSLKNNEEKPQLFKRQRGLEMARSKTVVALCRGVCGGGVVPGVWLRSWRSRTRHPSPATTADSPRLCSSLALDIALQRETTTKEQTHKNLLFVKDFVHYFPVSQPETQQSILVMTVNTPGGTRGRSLFTPPPRASAVYRRVSRRRKRLNANQDRLPIHYWWIERNIWFECGQRSSLMGK